MPNAVGIQFSLDSYPRFYKPTVEGLAPRDFCVVPDPHGGEPRVGMVEGFEGRCALQWERLPEIVRRASDAEIALWQEAELRRRETLAQARGCAQARGLPMKISSVRFDDERKLITFYFTAAHRIDFRELVRDLAGLFRSRIELWQIGTRREASQMGGFGPCGCQTCCTTWLHEQPAVSIKHARAQDLTQGPPNLAGACGRLRCCLRFEHESYCAMAEGAPAVGGRVRDGAGREGVVVERNLLEGRAMVRPADGAPQWRAFGELTALDRPRPACAEAEADAPADEEEPEG